MDILILWVIKKPIYLSKLEFWFAGKTVHYFGTPPPPTTQNVTPESKNLSQLEMKCSF